MKLALPGKTKVNNVTKLVIDNNEITEPKMIANELNSYFTGIADSVLKEAYPNRNEYTVTVVTPKGTAS